MKLQQEHGYNPMGGCMPMLLTMLVLFGFLGVVYYPVHYIFGVSNEAVKAACEAIGLATTNTSTMQTALIQAIHNGASIDPSIISASVVAEIQNFNTSFFGMDMCDVPGFHLTPSPSSRPSPRSRCSSATSSPRSSPAWMPRCRAA